MPSLLRSGSRLAAALPALAGLRSSEPPRPVDSSLKALVASERQRRWLNGYDDVRLLTAAHGVWPYLTFKTARRQHELLLEIGRRLDDEIGSLLRARTCELEEIHSELRQLKCERSRLRRRRLYVPVRRRRRELDALQARTRELDARRYSLCSENRYSDVALALLKELRPLGGEARTAHPLADIDAELAREFEQALSFFPADWLRSSSGRLSFEFGARAHYSHRSATVRLSQSRRRWPVELVHELTHRLEYFVKRLTVAEWVFHQRRVRGGDWRAELAPLHSLQELLPAHDYERHELARAHGFQDAYTGKVYGWGGPHDCFEILAMAFAELATGDWQVLEDDEVRFFALAALAVL